jgi:hypothetical protein
MGLKQFKMDTWKEGVLIDAVDKEWGSSICDAERLF